MQAREKQAWFMAALGSLAQNCALGLTFGSFGTLMRGFEVQFEASRGVVTTALGMLVLSMSLLSVPVGARLGRWSLRMTMICGSLMCAIGFALMILAQDIYQVIALYGLIIGPGVCLLGVLPASTLVSNWFVKDRGKALGLTNMPILLFITPPVIAYAVTHYGMSGVFVLLSVLFLLCCLAVTLVKDRPDSAASASANWEGTAGHQAPPPPVLSSRDILCNRAFWCLSLGVGIVAGGGTMITAHLVPLGMARNFSLEGSSLLLSAYAGAGLVGTMVFGWLADRLGARTALIINAGGQIVLWTALMVFDLYGIMLLLAAMIGICATSILAIHSAAINEIFGPENIAAVFGMSYVPKLLFIFGAAPLAGFLFDLSGSYQLALLVQITAFAAATIGFSLLPSRLSKTLNQGASAAS